MIDTSLNSSNFYFLLAVFQGVVLSVIILFQKPRSKPHTYLGILILLFSTSLLHMVLEESIVRFNAKFPVPMDFTLAYGPLSYLHVRYIKDPLRKDKSRDLLHFLPSLVIDVLFFSIFFSIVGEYYQDVSLIRSIVIATAIPSILQLAIYTYFIYKEIEDTKHVLKEFANVKKWMNYLIVSWSVLSVFLIFAVPFALIFVEELDENSRFIYKPMGIILSLCIFALGYLYLTTYRRVIQNYMVKIGKFKVSTSDLDNRKSQIHKVIITQQLYKDSSITVAKLAGHLGIPINNLSSIINETYHTNFNDLINRYRIEEFKEKILTKEGEKYSIVGLGEKVGFSSKASFYRAFKKETGTTPSEYVKSKS